MIIYPAIDLYAGKAVRLYQGDYAQMTVYSDNPEEVARAFREAGADHLHLRMWRQPLGKTAVPDG